MAERARRRVAVPSNHSYEFAPEQRVYLRALEESIRALAEDNARLRRQIEGLARTSGATRRR